MKSNYKTNRRQFIKTSMLAGTGLVLANPFTASASVLSANDKVNVAIVGCGGRGSGMIFNNIPKIPSANLVAVCDIVESRREKARDRFYTLFDKKIKAYENFYEMLEKENLDAVVLATPDFWHMQHSVDAMEAGLRFLKFILMLFLRP